MAVRVTSTIQIPEKELRFVFSRSGGPGGQNVNKVSTRVELLFDLSASPSLSDEEKELVVEKFASLMRLALARAKKRVPSKPSKASKRRRVDSKKTHSAKKAMRGRVHPSHD
jgi:ribosome-associated protein